ncbi:hypothetical protein J6590_034997 [Homalodisca vitripennis]|nr:hypothetical protein J6590_034997 [Homalodisca vitripennis]
MSRARALMFVCEPSALQMISQWHSKRASRGSSLDLLADERARIYRRKQRGQDQNHRRYYRKYHLRSKETTQIICGSKDGTKLLTVDGLIHI